MCRYGSVAISVSLLRVLAVALFVFPALSLSTCMLSFVLVFVVSL